VFTGLNVLSATKGKVKVPNACHEIIWGVEVSLPQRKMEATGQLRTSAVCSLRKCPHYLLNRRLCGPWCRSGCIMEEKNLLFLQGIELQFLGCPAHSHINVLTRPWSMDTHVMVMNHVPYQSHFISVNF